jgi:hypothetical protein
MSKPTETPSRRTAHRRDRQVAGPTAVGAKPDDPDADAELIRLCAKVIRCDELITRLDAQWRGAPSSDLVDLAFEESGKAAEAWHETLKQVAETAATTTAGLEAKARALYVAVFREAMWTHDADDYLADPQIVEDNLLGDGLVARSLCRDIFALVGDRAGEGD